MLAMLPDFPNLKRKLARQIRARVKEVHSEHTAPLSAAGMVCIHEGSRVFTVDEDGFESELPMKLHRATITIRDDEVESLTTGEIIARFDKAAHELATQTGTTVLESLDRSVNSVGNVVPYQGKITADALLAGYEAVLIDFNERRQPRLPTLLFGPQLHEEVREAQLELQRVPELRQRFADLMTKKYEEWRDRESSRKLVD